MKIIYRFCQDEDLIIHETESDIVPQKGDLVDIVSDTVPFFHTNHDRDRYDSYYYVDHRVIVHTGNSSQHYAIVYLDVYEQVLYNGEIYNTLKPGE